MAARYPIRLIPAATIARPMAVGMVMRRQAPAAESVITEAAQSAVAISKTLDPPNPLTGSNATFTITVSNNSGATVEDVEVNDLLSSGYLYVSSTESVGSYNDGTGVWTVGDMLDGASETLDIVATVLPTGEHANSATATYRATGDSAGGEPGTEPTPELPAGSDVWYDAPNASVIPFQLYSGAVSEITNAAEFGVDDDVASESDLSGVPTPVASAWWQLTVPAGLSTVLLTADTWLTTGGRLNSAGDGPADYPGDTSLAICTTSESPPLGPLPTPLTDFDTMTVVSGSDDDPDPSDPTRQYTSKVTNVSLTPGQVYWIRVDTWGSPTMYADGIAYRLRISLDYAP